MRGIYIVPVSGTAVIQMEKDQKSKEARNLIQKRILIVKTMQLFSGMT